MTVRDLSLHSCTADESIKKPSYKRQVCRSQRPYVILAVCGRAGEPVKPPRRARPDIPCQHAKTLQLRGNKAAAGQLVQQDFRTLLWLIPDDPRNTSKVVGPFPRHFFHPLHVYPGGFIPLVGLFLVPGSKVKAVQEAVGEQECGLDHGKGRHGGRCRSMWIG
jgi:hypothetical protein